MGRPLLPLSLCCAMAGRAVLFVNVASRCGFTPQCDPDLPSGVAPDDEALVVAIEKALG